MIKRLLTIITLILTNSFTILTLQLDQMSQHLKQSRLDYTDTSESHRANSQNVPFWSIPRNTLGQNFHILWKQSQNVTKFILICQTISILAILHDI